MTSPKTDKRLEEMLKSAYGKTWEDRSSVEKELAKYKDLVLSCCERKHLVSNARSKHLVGNALGHLVSNARSLRLVSNNSRYCTM